MTIRELNDIERILAELVKTFHQYPKYRNEFPAQAAMVRESLAAVRREQARRCWASAPEGWEPAIYKIKS